MDVSRSIEERPGSLPLALVAALRGLGCFVVIATVVILVGLFITHGPLHAPIVRWDTSVTAWFAARETPDRNALTAVGSGLGMTQVIIGLLLVAVIVLSILRRWRDLAFLVTAVALEASVALVSSIAVDRPRPSLIRLEGIPPTRSFPSGHTAAAIALYVGLAILTAPRVRFTALRTAIWALAVLLPFWVGISRIYRGMHHATDVLGSLLLGALALGAAWLVVGSTASAWRRRQVAARPQMTAEPTPHPAEVGP